MFFTAATDTLAGLVALPGGVLPAVLAVFAALAVHSDGARS